MNENPSMFYLIEACRQSSHDRLGLLGEEPLSRIAYGTGDSPVEVQGARTLCRARLPRLRVELRLVRLSGIDSSFRSRLTHEEGP